MSKNKRKRRSNRKPSSHTHFRELPSQLYREDPIDRKLLKFIKTRILPHIKLTGYKQKQKQKIASHCIVNLVIAQHRSKVIADSRHNTKYELRIQVWDALDRAGLVKVCLGSQSSGKTTRSSSGSVSQTRQSSGSIPW